MSTLRSWRRIRLWPPGYICSCLCRAVLTWPHSRGVFDGSRSATEGAGGGHNILSGDDDVEKALNLKTIRKIEAPIWVVILSLGLCGPGTYFLADSQLITSAMWWVNSPRWRVLMDIFLVGYCFILPFCLIPLYWVKKENRTKWMFGMAGVGFLFLGLFAAFGHPPRFIDIGDWISEFTYLDNVLEWLYGILH